MEIKLYGRYYYRGADYIPRRITVVEKGSMPGMYWCVNGHLYKHQIFDKKPERFLLHRNHITE